MGLYLVGAADSYTQLGLSRPLDKHPDSEVVMPSGVGFSRPLDKHTESESDLSSGGLDSKL